ncbi:MAG: hypothetical protein E6K54_08815 [Gammaproteobacteria bacterium]|nr:MAG: hypothetical protein E6K54_08815 [Gammaproteobacteria bacterium]
MSYDKFDDLITTGALYFCRSDLFSDPFEGSIPTKDVEKREADFEDISKKFEDFSEDRRQSWFEESQIRFRARHRVEMQSWFINCWHLSEYESAGMWHLYGDKENTVSIQSTYATFKELLPDFSFISMVKYIDYRTDSLLRGGWNIAEPFKTKRLSYEHEKEIRALINDDDLDIKEKLGKTLNASELKRKREGGPYIKGQNDIKGYKVSIDLQSLIQSIRVPPNASNDQKDKVKALIRKFGFDSNIVQRSEIDVDPVY